MNPFFIFFIGATIGIIVTIDPFISIVLSKNLDLEIYGLNLFKIYPFQFTSLTVLLTIVVLFGHFKYSKYIIEKKENILLFLIVASPQFKALSLGFFDMLDIPILFFLSIVFLEIIREKRFVLNTPLHLLLFLFVIVFLLSSIDGGTGSIITTIRISKSIVYSFILILLIKNKDDLIWAFKVLFILTAISSLIAIVQEFLYLTSGIIAVGNVSKGAVSLMFEPTPFGSILRAPAFFGLQSVFARTLAFVIPILFIFLIKQEMKDYFNRRFYSLCVILMVIALFLTYSRPSWLGVFIGLVICVYLRKPSFFIHFVTATFLLIIVAYVTGLTTKFQEEVYKEIYLGQDLHDRLFLAKESLEKIERHPFIGTGMSKASRYTPNVQNWPVHNGFLLTLVKTGILGFIIFCFSFIYIFYRLLGIFLNKDTTFKILAQGMLCGIFAYLVAIQFMTGSSDYIYFIYIIAFNASIIYHWSINKWSIIKALPSSI